MSELLCQSRVKKLLTAGINYKGYKSLVSYLNSQKNAPDWQVALIQAPELREKYWQAMVELQKELVPKHISLQDLYGKLWELFREVILNKAEFQSKAKMQEKIEVFFTEVKRSLIVFDVIYKVKNLDIGSQCLMLGNVRVFKLKNSYLQDWGLTQFGWLSDWIGLYIAKVTVNTADTQGANELGRTEINTALNILRVAVRKEFISRSSDSLFLWELGNSMVIPRTKPKEGVQFSVYNNKEIYPFIADLGQTIGKLLEDKNIWHLLFNAELPEDIHIRVMRAIEWISHSITTTNLDYKLVNLCTALEILLLPNHKREPKGALIALRHVLLGQGSYYEPAGILSLYEQRSQIVHGGYLNITSYTEYIHLLDCCMSVLAKIVRLSQKYPDTQELGKLLGIVENKETLEEFIKYCEQGLHTGRGIGKVKEAAQRRLEQCQ